MAASKVTVMLGFIPLAVRIEPAVDNEDGDLHTVCVGTDADPHAPARAKQSMACPVCGITHSSHWGFPTKGREEGNSIVVVTREEIEAASGTPRTGRAGKPPVEMAFHPREKVYGATVASDSVQNVYPDRGSEKAYAVLRDTLIASPDIVACMIWAPRSANALWVLEVVGDRIVATKRAWPEYVKPTQAIAPVEVPEAERRMFSTYIDSAVEDFDLSIYSDQRKLGVDALIAERAGQAIPLPAETPAPAGIPDLLAGLQANIDALKAAKAPAKKVAAKKAPAKAAAKKTTSTRKKVA